MQAWLGLGGNLPQTVSQLDEALSRLEASGGIRILKRSSYYRTPPWGDQDQADFINAVVQVETSLGAMALLGVLQSIENAMGRQRTARRWGPRLIDIDLLLYGDQTLHLPGLTVPHPHMHERAFVLLPIAEIDAGLVIPGHGQAGALLRKLDCEGIRRLADDG